MAITQISSILLKTYPPRYIFIDNISSYQPLDRPLWINLCPWYYLSVLSDSSINNSTHNIDPNTPQDILPFPPNPPDTQPDASSALVWHLLSNAKDLSFASKVDVATWCWNIIKVNILWQSNKIGLISTAGTHSCHLCAVERMLVGIGQTLCSTHWRKGLLHLTSEMHGICNCMMRFLRFSRSGQEEGLWWGQGKAQKQSCCDVRYRGLFFLMMIIVQYSCTCIDAAFGSLGYMWETYKLSWLIFTWAISPEESLSEICYWV